MWLPWGLPSQDSPCQLHRVPVPMALGLRSLPTRASGPLAPHPGPGEEGWGISQVPIGLPLGTHSMAMLRARKEDGDKHTDPSEGHQLLRPLGSVQRQPQGQGQGRSEGKSSAEERQEAITSRSHRHTCAHLYMHIYTCVHGSTQGWDRPSSDQCSMSGPVGGR